MRLLLSLCWWFVAMSTPACAAALPEYIPAEHRGVIQAWLTSHADYRLAMAEDCQCEEDIESLRRGPGGAWEPQPLYQPYAAAGDFDGDGIMDIAALMLPVRAGYHPLVLVSFGAKRSSPETIRVSHEEPSVIGLGLFARAPETGAGYRWRLLFGAFASEGEEIRVRRGG